MTGDPVGPEARVRSEERLVRLIRLKEQVFGAGALDEQLRLVTEGVVDFVGADFARIWMVRPGDLCDHGCVHAAVTEGPHACRDHSYCLHLMSSAGRYTRIDGSHRRVPLGSYKIGVVAAGTEPKFITNDVVHEPRVHNPGWAAELGLVSFAGYRLLSTERRPIGVLALFARRPIEAEEDALLEDLASTSSMAIQSGMAQEALRASELRYRMLFENANDGIHILAGDTFIECNSRALELYGCDERADMVGHTPIDFSPPLQPDGRDSREKAIAYIEAALAGTPQRFYWQHRRKDGALFDAEVALSRLEWGGKPSVLAVVRDISERMRAEAERAEMERRIAHSEKLEAIGTLASGIAHDFNNILSAVVGYTELALNRTPAGTPLRRDLEAVMQGAQRAADLVRQILTFSRQTPQEVQQVPLGPLVNETLKFLRASLPATIEIRPRIASRAQILADPTEVQRLVVNLCTNAALAMEDRGGVLEIALEDVTAGAEPGVAGDGPAVRLVVRDTGCGMTREVMARIFEPFYTTREAGEGTGMGLAVVHGIVTSRGGAIAVESEPGIGTTFRITFPAAAREASRAAPERPGCAGGSERVLYVDDEPMIARLAVETLGALGYAVHTFTDSKEALAAFAADPQGFDLAITDLTMPHLTGDELALRLKALRPDLPVILCTGCNEKITAEIAQARGIDEFLMKPFSAAELTTRMREVLARRRP